MSYHPDSSGTISIINHLHCLFDEAIKQAYPEISIPAEIRLITNAKFGDYQFNSAMRIAKTLKSQGQNNSPREIADKIYGFVKKSPIVNKLDVAPAGFINIFLEK